MSEFSIPGLSIRIPPDEFPNPQDSLADSSDTGRAILAGGCFWCVEAVYLALVGVKSVRSGYAGGTAETADYRSVCSGTTGHAEVVEVTYDSGRSNYGELLKLFFSIAHDPTQLNHQGNDRGRQYRSAIFFENAGQQEFAQTYILELAAANAFRDPIVTTLEPLDAFYPAETYHQNYAARNPHEPYVAATAGTKVEKLRRYFSDRLK